MLTRTLCVGAWLWRLSLVLGVGLVAWPAIAQPDAQGVPQPQTIHLGVYGSRSAEVVRTRFGPLAQHLSERLGVPVTLLTLSDADLASEITHQHIDLLLTNPSHFLQLRALDPQVRKLATVVRNHRGQPVTALGGLVFARSDRTELNTLTDLQGQRLAALGGMCLGAHHAQLLELHDAGLALQPGQLRFLGSHDEVVRAVLDREVDVGFMCSGELEYMAEEGLWQLSDFKTLNAQHHPSYPLRVSTRLYPEWPLLAMPHVSTDLARRTASILLALEPNHPAMQAARLWAFDTPADYSAAEHLLSTLRLPPYDTVPEFTLIDVWTKHQVGLMASAVLLVALVLSAAWLLRLSRRLRQLLLAQRRSRHELLEQRELLAAVMESMVAPMFYKDVEGHYLGCNAAFAAFMGLPREAIVGKTIAELAPPERVKAYLAADEHLLDDGRPHVYETQVVSATQEVHDVVMHKSVFRHADGQIKGIVGVAMDITDRRRAERALQLAASVFSHAQEGILITDQRGLILDANASFSRITGYRLDEVVGRNPSLLSSGRQDADFYQTLWTQLLKTGQWHGEIWNRRKSGEVFAEVLTITAVRDAQGTDLNYVAVFSDITVQKEHQSQLEFIAHFDPLTGLPNRALLADRLQQAMAQAQRRNTQAAVVFLDLDGFKQVNDTHGHGVGDELLQTLAQRLKDSLREGDTLARVGGDEFVAVLTDVGGLAECDRVLARLLTSAAAPVKLHSATVQVSASVGVALYPQDGTEADSLLRHADQAMYQAKQAGKNRYQLFDRREDEASHAIHRQTERLAQALRDQELVLHYQPKVNMRTGQVVGVEALVRWQHPTEGLQAPGSFLPLIEGLPLSVTLGNWVLETAMCQLESWQALGLRMNVSVNVAAHQLQQRNFVAELQTLLQRHPSVAPAQLQLEVLETSALEDMAWVSEVMRACQGLGVDFALDDFGTGYSSLTYLRHLPAQVLKIDQSFVRNMLTDSGDLTIVEGVIGLTHAFSRTAIAEGVETLAHGELLLRLGCDLGQGYGIARPMPAADLPPWVAQWAQPTPWQAHRNLVPDRDAMPLVFAEVEHRHWMAQLTRYAASTHPNDTGTESTPPPPLTLQACRFGQWLNSPQSQHFRTRPGFDQVVHWHNQVHHLGGELVAQDPHSPDQAQHLQALEHAGQALLGALRQLTR